MRDVDKRLVDEILPSSYIEWCIRCGYNPREPTTWIAYVDANSLYPTVMTKNLPTRSYCLVDIPPTTSERLVFLHSMLDRYHEDNVQGFFVVVTYHVPRELHDYFDYAPVCKRVVEVEELSEYQQELNKRFRKNQAPTDKLFPFLGEQREVMHHIELLQYMVQKGVVVTELREVWSFHQEAWMKKHVEDLTSSRAASSDPVEKQMFKISNNSLYGKTGQDPLKHLPMVAHFNEESYANMASKARVFKIFYDTPEDGFFGLTSGSRSGSQPPLVNTPRAIAFSILELSKLVVWKAHYKYFRPCGLGGSMYKLLMTDTDSLTYLLQTESLSHDLLCSKSIEFDLANTLKSVEAVKKACPEDPNPEETFAMLKKRKGKLGAFKLESDDACVTEFVGLAPKMYSMRMRLADGSMDTICKGKGVPNAVLKRNTDHSSYRNMLFEPYESNVTFKKLQSFKHQMHSLQLTRRMLTALQDKTFQLSPLESRPLGHWRNHVDSDEEL